MRQELEFYSELEFEQVLHLFCSRPDIRKQFGWREYNNSPQLCFGNLYNAIVKDYPDSPLNSEESYKKAYEWDDTRLWIKIKTTKQEQPETVISLIEWFYKQNPEISPKRCTEFVNRVLEKQKRKKTSSGYVRNKLSKLRKLRKKNT